MTDAQVLSVSDLMWKLKDTVEQRFPWVCVEGELSNVTRAGSGHVYFTLKDDRSQIRGVIWKRAAAGLRFKLADGLAVLATGPVEVYAARGSVQLIVEHLVPRGVGELELAFRQLQQKLQTEGLFDPAHKQPLPRFPRRVAIVTSSAGAALRDILKVMSRRWRACDVVVLPVRVQGTEAAGEIAAAIRTLPLLTDVDVAIVGRGGGSLEDLWAFNEEVVARAISECPIPIISAVGHEVDVSIADLVADVRAATPTDAGQIVVPDRLEVLNLLSGCSARLQQALSRRLSAARSRLEALASRRVLARPLDRIHELSARTDALQARLTRASDNRLETARHRYIQLARQLDALSPLKVLTRGYSITENTRTSSVVRSVHDVQPGDVLRTRIADGSMLSEVSEIHPNQKPSS